MAKTQEKANRKVYVEGRASFPNLVKGKINENNNKRQWELTIVLDEGYDLTPLKRAGAEALKAEFGDKAAGMIKSKEIVLVGGKNCLIRNDETKSYPKGETRIGARTYRKPGVVSRFPDPKNPKLPAVIPEDEVEQEIYPGARVRATVEAYYYDNPKNKGLTWSLGNVQKIGDGERLDSYVNAQDEFESDPTAVAELESLEEQDVDVNADEDDDLSDLGL